MYRNCRSKKNAGTNGKIDDGEYTVNLCCISDQKTYTYPDGKSKKLIDRSKCNYVPDPNPQTTYTITYVLNGGTVSGNPSTYSESTLPITLNQPVQTGYTFNGWTGQGLSEPTKSVTIPKGTTGNLTYTANWTINTSSTPTYTCTINFIASSGSFTNNTSNTQKTVTNGNSMLLNNPLTYYGAKRNWFTVDTNSAWIDDKNIVFNAGTSYTALQLCGNDLNSKNVTKTFRVNWRRTKINLRYNTSGAILKPSHACYCPDAAHCQKGECDKPKNLSGCTGENTGFIWERNLPNDTDNWNSKGLADYTSPTGASLYLEKNGKRGDGYWRVGKTNGTPKIYQTDTFATGRSLARKCGDTYYEKLKSKDIIINVYAGGF